ncbi:MAG: hypothetical protein J1E63_09175 [Muribaculaceae bacterium]|nr:hypothetical protein [Muribaculaceae bacterium]
MLKTILLTIALLAIAFVGLGVKVLFIKGAKFPSGHAHDNPALRRRGISCATNDVINNNAKNNNNTNNNNPK